MKTKTLVAALPIAITVLAVHSMAFATDPSASGHGAVSTHNTISGNFSLGSNGASTSYAHNSETATAKITGHASATPGYGRVHADIQGAATTSSTGIAYNVSTGSGTGSAMSAGGAGTAIQGITGIRGVSTGFNGGNAGTQTDNRIEAGKNQGSYVEGETMSGFEVHLHYAKTTGMTSSDTRSTTVSLTSHTTGYASGENASGALYGMNAAGIANIGASGRFFAGAGLSAATGDVSAP